MKHNSSMFCHLKNSGYAFFDLIGTNDYSLKTANPEAQENDFDIREDLGHRLTEVKISHLMTHNVLTIVEEYVQ